MRSSHGNSSADAHRRPHVPRRAGHLPDQAKQLR